MIQRESPGRSVVCTLLVAAVAFTMIPGADAAEVVVPTDFTTIPAAIDALAQISDPSNTILVEPGTYTVNLSLIDNLTLRGRETSRTFLDVGDDAQSTGVTAAINATGVDNVQVSNFTFIGGQAGAVIEASANVRISNNVFLLGTDGTALSAITSSSVTVENNTFVGNGTALARDSDQVVVRNNIFADNGMAISPGDFAGNISFNGFFANTDDGAVGSDAITAGLVDFADPVHNDFHLVEGSAAIDAGFGIDAIDDTRSDLGAFGGADSDRRPFSVQNLTVAEPIDTSVTVTWDRNPAYLVTNSGTPGSYRVYYGARSGDYSGTDAAEGTSPIAVGDVNTFTLSGLTGPAELPAPSGLTLSPADSTLHLHWSEVSGAVGYRVRYGVASTAENQIDVGNVTGYDLTGLTNGTSYRVTVSVLSQATVFAAVSALDNTDAHNESVLSNEVQARFGAVRESLPSGEMMDFPEKLEARPKLPDEGCFIATAAFGFYDAAQVQALRDFRDQYLLPHSAGRLFVGWYYRNSPAAAHWLNQHPRLKPLVRALLLPAVAISSLLTGRTSPWLAVGILLSFFVARRLYLRRGLERVAHS